MRPDARRLAHAMRWPRKGTAAWILSPADDERKDEVLGEWEPHSGDKAEAVSERERIAAEILEAVEAAAVDCQLWRVKEDGETNGDPIKLEPTAEAAPAAAPAAGLTITARASDTMAGASVHLHALTMVEALAGRLADEMVEAAERSRQDAASWRAEAEAMREALEAEREAHAETTRKAAMTADDYVKVTQAVGPFAVQVLGGVLNWVKDILPKRGV